MKKYSTIQAWPVSLLASGPIRMLSAGLRLAVKKEQVTEEYRGMEGESVTRSHRPRDGGEQLASHSNPLCPLVSPAGR